MLKLRTVLIRVHQLNEFDQEAIHTFCQLFAGLEFNIVRYKALGKTLHFQEWQNIIKDMIYNINRI